MYPRFGIAGISVVIISCHSRVNINILLICSSDSTEPETPKARDGPTGSDTQQALPDTQPDTASDLTSPEKDNAPGKVEVIEKPKDEGVLEGELKEEDVQEKVASDELKVERMVEEEGKGGEDKQEELAAELLEARKREQDLPSFDEWKLKIIAEQAEQAKQAKQEKMEGESWGFLPEKVDRHICNNYEFQNKPNILVHCELQLTLPLCFLVFICLISDIC